MSDGLTRKVRDEIRHYALRPPIKFSVSHIMHPRRNLVLCGAVGKGWFVFGSADEPDHKMCRACRRVRDGR